MHEGLNIGVGEAASFVIQLTPGQDKDLVDLSNVGNIGEIDGVMGFERLPTQPQIKTSGKISKWRLWLSIIYQFPMNTRPTVRG